MKLSCDVIRDLLPLYADRAASADTAALVEEHLASCPACREELGRLGAALPAEPEGAEALKQMRLGKFFLFQPTHPEWAATAAGWRMRVQ